MAKREEVVVEQQNEEVTPVTTPVATLSRANKVTAYWGGEGVAIGSFSRTHNKVATVKSTDEAVVAAGFAFAETQTAQEKLEAFKTFLSINASVFGVIYDPVDRRADEFKYPSKYDVATMLQYSKSMLEMAVGETLDKVQNNVISSLIKSGNLAEGTTIQFGIGAGVEEVTEIYNSGTIKYASVKYPVVITVGDKSAEAIGKIDLVSGQLKKPRELGEVALTMTGIKTFLTDAGVLPVVVKAVKEEKADDQIKEVATAPDVE